MKRPLQEQPRKLAVEAGDVMVVASCCGAEESCRRSMLGEAGAGTSAFGASVGDHQPCDGDIIDRCIRVVAVAIAAAFAAIATQTASTYQKRLCLTTIVAAAILGQHPRY